MTENQWAQCFQEQGEQILGVNAQDLGDWFISDKENYDRVFEVTHLTIFHITLDSQCAAFILPNQKHVASKNIKKSIGCSMI
jgi:hypothetical protein